MKPPFSIALISLPGAHLAQLSQLLCELTGRDNAVDCEIGAARGRIYVLPSDFFETSGASALDAFRKAGNKVVFVRLDWAQSFRSVTQGAPGDAAGLPWRTAYRHLARERTRQLEEFSDVCVDGSGTLAEIADRVHLALSDFEA